MFLHLISVLKHEKLSLSTLKITYFGSDLAVSSGLDPHPR
ncbi:hypothetical protein CBSLWZGG_CDS9 [Pseudomonas phage PseuPha1]|nr:hypothetical protein CBSLWZGG_CDS9 [Pseudomonas phage PseuPha1]